MEYFFLSLISFSLMILLMSVGVILGKKRIKGSCGGLNNLMGRSESACYQCDEEKKKAECEDFLTSDNLCNGKKEDCDKKDDCPFKVANQ